MSNFSNKHRNMVVSESKPDLQNKMSIQIQKNKTDIGKCVDERIKNDKDIDAIRKAINSNQKVLKELLGKMEYLEKKMDSFDTGGVSDNDSDNMEVIVTDGEQD